MQSLPVVNITDWNQVSGSNTYFRTSDVTPYVHEGKLHIFNSRGISRSWGTPSVTSRIETLTDDIIKVNVVGWHKHTISPVGGNFYFVNEGKKGWVRRRANHRKVKAVLATY